MSPEELKNMAREASRREYESIMADLQQAAKQGTYSATFHYISDGAVEQLREEGFILTKKILSRSAIGPAKEGWLVSFNDKKD